MKTSRMLLVAAVVGGLSAAGCGSSSSGSSSSTAPSGPVVTIKNIAYNPSKLSVNVGQKVTWIWADGAIPHNVDGASDLPSFSSGGLKTSGSWSYTFTKAGTYSYHCDLHPNMQGEITVS